MVTTRKRTPKPRPALVVESGYPPVAQAAAIAMRLLAEGGASTWNQFASDDDTYRTKALSKVSVSPEQGALLDKFAEVLTWLVRYPKTEDKAAVSTTIALCPTCNEFTIVTSAAPTTCRVTDECRRIAEDASTPEEKAAVKPLKVKAATRAKADAASPSALTPVAMPEPEVLSEPEPAPLREVSVTEDGAIKPVVSFNDEADDEDWGKPATRGASPQRVSKKPASVDDSHEAPVNYDDLTDDF